MKLYPGSDACVEIKRSAALHLYQLLERYNWCISDPKKYKRRWRTFWRSILQVERSFLVMFVRANCEGRFGKRLRLEALPTDFSQAVPLRVKLNPNDEVMGEFQRLMNAFYTSLTTPAEIDMLWLEKCPSSRTALQSIGALEEVLRAFYDPIAIESKSLSLLMQGGVDEQSASQHAQVLSTSVKHFFAWMTDSIFDTSEKLWLH